MKLAAPLIIAAHVAHLPTLDGWTADGDRPAVAVYEGAATRRDDIRRHVTVGYLAGDEGPAVHMEPETNGQGQNLEAGSIACGLVVTAADIAAARTAVFGLLAPWAQWLATDATLAAALGTAQLLPGSTLTLTADVVLSALTRGGATASAIVSITYTANTYG